MNIQVITQPASEPLTTAEAKKQCEISTDVTAHDSFIDDLIKAARIYVEKRTGIALFTQTVAQRWDCFPHLDKYDKFRSLELGYGEIQSVTHLKYVDENGDEQTMAVDTGYQLSLTSTPPKIIPAYNTTWPTTRPQADAVWCEYVRGWSSVDDIPETLKRAMLMMVNTWFECRNDPIRRFPTAAGMLIDQFIGRYL